MRTILGIGKDDAYFEDRAHLIGQRCAKVSRIDIGRNRGGYISANIELDKPIDLYPDVKYTFAAVKLSKKG